MKPEVKKLVKSESKSGTPKVNKKSNPMPKHIQMKSTNKTGNDSAEVIIDIFSFVCNILIILTNHYTRQILTNCYMNTFDHFWKKVLVQGNEGMCTSMDTRVYGDKGPVDKSENFP